VGDDQGMGTGCALKQKPPRLAAEGVSCIARMRFSVHQQPSLQQPLEIAAAVGDDHYLHLLGPGLIDDAVGAGEQFARHVDAARLRQQWPTPRSQGI